MSHRTEGERFPVDTVREEFPILRRTVRDKPLVYLDNASTTQKPRAVLDALTGHYERTNANVHRGVHSLSMEATNAYEAVRGRVKRFLGAPAGYETVFVRGTTEGINLVAQSWGGKNIGRGDEIIVSEMEHHSNIVPWQMLCEEKGAVLRVIPINDEGELLLEGYEELLCERTRLVAVVHVSNSLGTLNPVDAIVERAHARGIPVLVDGAQAAPHIPVDLGALDADFYVFSGHKTFAPTGIGALVARRALLEEMPPWQGGGEMIRSVSFEGTVYNGVPGRFEAGTPNIAGTVALGAALDYLEGIGLERIAAYEDGLLAYATGRVSEIEGLRVVGTAAEKASILSFVMDVAHPHDVGTILDMEGIAIRTGHHCTEPVMRRLGLPATARASFAFYNTREEIDALVAALHKVREVMG